MKKQKDIGLAYIQKIGISTPRTLEDLQQELVIRCGEKRTLAFFERLPEEENREFYDAKDAEPDLARIYTGSWDADLIRRSANWIHAHHSAFGQEILEVGCDLGFVTGFLAREFPSAHITAIDHSAAAIRAARSLMEELGVTNVTLVHAELADFLSASTDFLSSSADYLSSPSDSLSSSPDVPSGDPEESPERRSRRRTYDTIVSMRVLQENYDDLPFPCGQVLNDLFNLYYLPRAHRYAGLLSQAIRPGGTLISVMIGDQDPALAAWMMELRAIGWSVDYRSYEQLTCRHPNEEAPQVHLQAFVSRAEAPLDLHAMDPTWDPPTFEQNREALNDRLMEARDFWIRLLDIPYSLPPVLYGWAAMAVCNDLSGELITGVGIYSEEEQKGKFALYTLEESDQAVLLYQELNGNVALYYVPIQQLAECQALLDRLEAGTDPDLSPDMQKQNLTVLRIAVEENTGLELPVLTRELEAAVLEKLRSGGFPGDESKGRH